MEPPKLVRRQKRQKMKLKDEDLTSCCILCQSDCSTFSLLRNSEEIGTSYANNETTSTEPSDKKQTDKGCSSLIRRIRRLDDGLGNSEEKHRRFHLDFSSLNGKTDCENSRTGAKRNETSVDHLMAEQSISECEKGFHVSQISVSAGSRSADNRAVIGERSSVYQPSTERGIVIREKFSTDDKDEDPSDAFTASRVVNKVQNNFPEKHSAVGSEQTLDYSATDDPLLLAEQDQVHRELFIGQQLFVFGDSTLVGRTEATTNPPGTDDNCAIALRNQETSDVVMATATGNENQTAERGESSATFFSSKSNLKPKNFPHNGSKLSWHFPCRISKEDANMNERAQLDIRDNTNMTWCKHHMNREMDNATSNCDLNQLVKEKVITKMQDSFSSQQTRQRLNTWAEKQDERPIQKPIKASAEPKESAFDTSEQTHMTWDEVMREAELLGVPLRRSVSGLRLNCDGPSSSPRGSRPPSTTVEAKERPSLQGNSLKDKSKTSSCLRKGALFNLCTWLDKLSLSSSQKASVKRQQHISCPSADDSHNAALLPSSSSSSVVRQSQGHSHGLRSRHRRRSLSASSTLRSSRGVNGSGHELKPLSLCSPSPPPTSSISRQSSSLSRNISASGSRDSTSSFLSTSMLVSPSSGSLCSVFSRSSRESIHGTTPQMVQTFGELSTTESPLPLSSPRVLLRRSESPTAAATAAYTTSSSSSSSIRKSGSQQMNNGGNNQRSNMDQLKQCRWYWGSLDWEAAVRILLDVPDGAFLLRDSQDDRFLFSLSFRSQGAVHHSRIDHYKGNFSFASPESALSSSSVLELVQKGVAYCRHHPYLYCLNPRSPGTSPVPVRLLFPVNRVVSPSSLQSLCQSVIVGRRGKQNTLCNVSEKREN